MIPKIIHYIWFGGNQLPTLAEKCIESWKKYCPDYTIKKWSEDNFDIEICPYVKEAYTEKKWAFVSDFVRLYALYNEGGIYMDTDVELIKPLNTFLNHEGFSGFENGINVPTGIMGCEKGNTVIKMLLDEYYGRHFVLKDGTIDLTTNVTVITDAFLKLGLKQDNSYQELNGFALYPKSVFCPIDQQTGVLTISDDTTAIHHFDGSWRDDETRKLSAIGRKIRIKYKNQTVRKVLFILQGLPWLFKRRFRNILETRKRSCRRK